MIEEKPNKWIELLTSRKTWAALIGIGVALGLLQYSDADQAELVGAIVTIATAIGYMISVAIEDGPVRAAEITRDSEVQVRAAAMLDGARNAVPPIVRNEYNLTVDKPDEPKTRIRYTPSPELGVMEALRDVYILMESSRPDDRSPEDRAYAVTLTEMEKVIAYFATWAYDEVERDTLEAMRGQQG